MKLFDRVLNVKVNLGKSQDLDFKLKALEKG